MSKDIGGNGSSYYRKKGSANNKIPLRWTPPDAVRTHKFGEKSDVWSFGVVVFEIYSFGEVPFAHIANKDVFAYVTAGNRLDRPAACPDPMYSLMMTCWLSNSEARPTFSELVRSLGRMATQDERERRLTVSASNAPPSFLASETTNEPTEKRMSLVNCSASGDGASPRLRARSIGNNYLPLDLIIDSGPSSSEPPLL
eukprot:Opistho-2@89733